MVHQQRDKRRRKSSVREVREWYNQTQVQQAATHLVQASNQLVPPRKGFINLLAEQVYKTIKTYDAKLPKSQHITKPTSFKKAANSPHAQWFAAEEKEKDGMLQFQTWDRLDQKQLTSDIRRRALRCHHLYDIKRDQSAKNRVVVNGSKQHSDTYSDTTSPVAGQLLLRLFLTVTPFRQYKVRQLDLTNAYLHAPIQDVVFIYVPDGFPGAGEIARLNKAAYGTKQGARRFYDYTAKVFNHIGLVQCPNDPCLYRYLFSDHVCFVLQYVDDVLLAGDDTALDHLEKELAKYFQCKFTTPKDFLGLDLTITKPGDIRLSMSTFTSKMETVLSIHDPFPGVILTHGRTEKKVNRNDQHEPNEQYRSHVGSLNWLTMGLRYDMAFTTKELSRVLCAPTSLANQLVQRALVYAIRTKDAYLHFSHDKTQNYTPPKTRKKPTDTTDLYNTDHDTSDGITHVDDTNPKPDI